MCINNHNIANQRAIFEISNIQLDSEAVRTTTIETRWDGCGKYLHIFMLIVENISALYVICSLCLD